jgi:hypothetical protein
MTFKVAMDDWQAVMRGQPINFFMEGLAQVVACSMVRTTLRPDVFGRPPLDHPSSIVSNKAGKLANGSTFLRNLFETESESAILPVCSRVKYDIQVAFCERVDTRFGAKNKCGGHFCLPFGHRTWLGLFP